MVSRLILAFSVLLPVWMWAEEPVPVSSFTSSWYSIDNGGGISSGGEFQILGAVGQSDTDRSSGGSFEVVGGFLSVLPTNGCDNLIDDVFCDDFETGTTDAWTQAVGLAPSAFSSANVEFSTSERSF